MTATPERVRGAPAAGAGVPRTWVTRLSGALHARPRLRLAGLLSVPMLWLLVAYLGSLAVMFAAAFWSVDSFTGDLVRVFTLDNLRTLATEQVYRTIALRTIGIAVAVTLLDVVLAVPMAFFMAKVAPRRGRGYLVVGGRGPALGGELVQGGAVRR